MQKKFKHIRLIVKIPTFDLCATKTQELNQYFKIFLNFEAKIFQYQQDFCLEEVFFALVIRNNTGIKKGS